MPMPWPQPWPLMKKVGCVRTVGGAGVLERPGAALPVKPSAAARTMAKTRIGMPRNPRERVEGSGFAERFPQSFTASSTPLSTRFRTGARGQATPRGRFCMPVETSILPPRYRSPKRVASGGMGEIYRATDDTLGRAVAVKLLAERYSRDEGVRQRFTREALAAARLSGEPHIVTIFDVGEHAGRPFIVMEYLSGGSLEQRVRKDGAQKPGQALEWLEQAAVALDAAHRNGVVHRDVKPANLLLDRNDNIHVADFGIASAAGMDSLTMTGTVLRSEEHTSELQSHSGISYAV